MSEPVKQSVIEKINHTRQGLQRAKWQPSKEAVICNVHYADFKGPTRVNPDVLPIYFKRPTSYPAATSACTNEEKTIREKATTSESYQK